MDAGWAAVVAAFVAAVGAIIVAVLDKFRKENHTDHQVVLGMLKILHKGQQRVEERLDNHLEFHATEGMLDNERTVHQDGVETNRRVS